MKCIKAIKATKEIEVGTIKRVDDKTAFNMVGLSWKYISKSEWKNSTRNQVGTKSEPSRDQVDIVSESTEKKPYKKGTKYEKHKNKQ
jgi:hypothetical protein